MPNSLMFVFVVGDSFCLIAAISSTFPKKSSTKNKSVK